jgi:hypothetical protein
MNQIARVSFFWKGMVRAFTLFALASLVSPVLAWDNKPIEKPRGNKPIERSGVPGVANVVEYLIQLNREMMEEYILHHNTGPNSVIMLDDFLFVASIGKIETKEDVIATVGNLDIQSVKIIHNEFRHHGPTAVLVGTLHLQGSISNNEINAQIRFMSVFIHQHDQWRLMARSFSPIVHPSVLYGESERL